MKNWLELKFFIIACSLAAILQFSKIASGQVGGPEVFGAMLGIPVMGLFWGAIFTFVAKKLRKK